MSDAAASRRRPLYLAVCSPHCKVQRSASGSVSNSTDRAKDARQFVRGYSFSLGNRVKCSRENVLDSSVDFRSARNLSHLRFQFYTLQQPM